MVIYADEVFIINLTVNYLVLLAAAKLCALPTNRRRIAFGAALGGVYAVFALLVPFFMHPAAKASAGAIMTAAAFGGHKRLLRITVTVFAVSAAFGGVIYALAIMNGMDTSRGGYVSVSFKVLIASFGICYLAVSLVYKRMARTNAEIVSLTVEYRGRQTVISALEDTGNSLTDPITGDPVIIVGRDCLSPLFDGYTERFLALSPEEMVRKMSETGHRFRLIAYSAVGVESGLMAAFRPDSVKSGGKKVKNCIIAVSPNEVSDGGAYSALIGADYV